MLRHPVDSSLLHLDYSATFLQSCRASFDWNREGVQIFDRGVLENASFQHLLAGLEICLVAYHPEWMIFFGLSQSEWIEFFGSVAHSKHPASAAIPA